MKREIGQIDQMDIEERAREIVARLKEEYPSARIMLRYSNNFELLVAVILSAQCTDKKVNEVTATLFKKYKGTSDFATASLEELERDVRPTGFYRNKARSIQGSARMVLERFGG